jgi:hypothetical protein
MKLRGLLIFTVVVLSAVVVSSGQEKAAVQLEKADLIRAGGPIVLKVKLNEPLPKGARFDLRISPVGADEEIALGGGEPINNSQTEFRISGTLPEGALPGDWHISIIYFFLPGAGWTHSTIAPNDLRFHVEGKSYPIPTKAEVSISR